MRTGLLLISILLAFASAEASAQNRDSLKGFITDAYGAVLPGAKVELKGASFDQQKRTDSDGDYAFDNVPLGHYHLLVTARGFHRTFNYEADFRGGESGSYDFALAPCSDEPSKTHSDYSDDADSPAIVRELIWQLVPETSAPTDKKPILEAVGFDRTWLTADQTSKLRIMSWSEIQTLAARTKNQEYWWISPLQLRGSCVEASLFNNLMPHNRKDVLVGGGAKVYEFRKINGKWTAFLFGTPFF